LVVTVIKPEALEIDQRVPSNQSIDFRRWRQIFQTGGESLFHVVGFDSHVFVHRVSVDVSFKSIFINITILGKTQNIIRMRSKEVVTISHIIRMQHVVVRHPHEIW
jgi:hypothetical protein